MAPSDIDPVLAEQITQAFVSVTAKNPAGKAVLEGESCSAFVAGTLEGLRYAGTGRGARRAALNLRRRPVAKRLLPNPNRYCSATTATPPYHFIVLCHGGVDLM
jgi:hypothetical protein